MTALDEALLTISDQLGWRAGAFKTATEPSLSLLSRLVQTDREIANHPLAYAANFSQAKIDQLWADWLVCTGILTTDLTFENTPTAQQKWLDARRFLNRLLTLFCRTHLGEPLEDLPPIPKQYLLCKPPIIILFEELGPMFFQITQGPYIRALVGAEFDKIQQLRAKIAFLQGILFSTANDAHKLLDDFAHLLPPEELEQYSAESSSLTTDMLNNPIMQALQVFTQEDLEETMEDMTPDERDGFLDLQRAHTSMSISDFKAYWETHPYKHVVLDPKHLFDPDAPFDSKTNRNTTDSPDATDNDLEGNDLG